MMNDRGIYLTRPRGRIKKPIDTAKDRIKWVAKVNEDYIKFGKSERPLKARYRDYQRIFGDDVIFEPIIILNDKEKLRAFEDHIKNIFPNNFKISNPGSSRKLEWMTGITFEEAKEKIIEEYKKFNN